MKRYGLMILGIFLILLGIIIKLIDGGSSYNGNGSGSGSGNSENGLQETLTADKILSNYSSSSPYKCSVELE